MNKSLKAVVTGSIILNVILIGLYVGHLLHCCLIPNDSHQAVRQLLAQLPEQRRQFVESNLEKIWHDLADAHTEINSGKKVALSLMEAEPFNDQLYTAQMQKLNQMHNQMKDHMTQSLIILAKQLNQQERSILAQITFYPPPDLPPTPLGKDK